LKRGTTSFKARGGHFDYKVSSQLQRAPLRTSLTKFLPRRGGGKVKGGKIINLGERRLFDSEKEDLPGGNRKASLARTGESIGPGQYAFCLSGGGGVGAYTPQEGGAGGAFHAEDLVPDAEKKKRESEKGGAVYKGTGSRS